MKERALTTPELIAIAVTRVALGVGIGLLVADKFSPKARESVGFTLFALGALSTIPLLLDVFTKPLLPEP